MSATMTQTEPTRESADYELFRQLNSAADDDHAQEHAREALVERYTPLVHWAVGRYAGRGEQAEELQQVAYLGLVEAIGRFELDRGVAFAAYATPTVLGEIRRHFRDRRRWVRIPRRIQELKMSITKATEELAQSKGHTPSHTELAEHLGCAQSAVTEALAADDTFAPFALDAPMGDDDAASSYLDALGDEDAAIDDVDDSESLWPLLQELPWRERNIVLMRFYGNQTQSAIADQLGISQMHVSRLLQQTLTKLRSALAD